MPIIQTQKQLRPRDPNEHYPTPLDLCQAALKQCLPGVYLRQNGLRILDPGAGVGVWGEAARSLWPGAEIYGVELRPVKCNPAYTEWRIGNYMTMTVEYGQKFDLIIGNPPYGDLWEQEQSRLKREAHARGEVYVRPPRPADQPMADAKAFIRKSLSELRDGGHLLYLLRLAFLEGQDRGKGLWSDFPPYSVHALSRRPSFTGNGKTDATAYAVYVWEKGYRPAHYWGGWLDW